MGTYIVTCSSAAVKMESIPGRGVKRKHVEEDYYAWQRKSIIDVSMGKLRTSSSQRSEPCLRRSVLILNTLKHIETELAQEGVDTHRSTEAAINEIPEMSVSQLTLDPLPDISTFIYPLPASSPVPISVEASSGIGSENCDYLSVVDLLPCKPLAGCQDQPLSHSQTSSGFLGAQDMGHGVPAPQSYYGESSLNSGTVSSPSTMYYGSLSPSADLSEPAFYSSLSPSPVYELPKLYEAGDSNNNFTALGPYNLISSNSPTGEDSLSEAEVIDLLHSLQEAADSAAAPNLSHTPAPPSSPGPVLNAQCSTYCRTDSTLDDLDSIMQILVGM